jgi:Domain of unknown function (DUF4326)
MSPQRIQRRRTKGWRMPEGAVYVGRPTKWGNPFRIYHGHSIIGPPWSLARESWWHLPASACLNGYITSSRAMTAADSVEPFRDLIRARLRDEPVLLRAWLAPLIGKDLACWCPLVDKHGEVVPCHADVLLRIANGGAA